MAAFLARPCSMIIEPSRVMRAKGFDWDHTIEVALPPSYHQSEASYPVFWVMDGNAYFWSAVDVIHWLSVVGLAPEMIVVGVGPDRRLSQAEAKRRRTFDLSPNEDLYFDGLGADRLRRLTRASDKGDDAGGAPGFLDFLVDQVRPALAADYRLDPNEHTLFGHSGGGMFVGYSIFARPGAFSRYICGSPSLNAGNFEIFELEKSYAESHDDLPVRIFLGAGEQIDEPSNAMWSFVGSMARLAETLHLRDYPSLRLTTRIFPGESHITAVWPLLTWGIRTLWADRAS